MKDRDEAIVEAAIRLFIRYGVKRTGMGDIAAEAGISRQTLYNAFSNKDAVLQATIRLLADRTVEKIEAGLAKVEGLGAQLDVVFRHVVVDHFELLHASPNAEDIVAGFNAASQKELEAAAKRNIAIITRILAPHSTAIEREGQTVAQFAEFVNQSAVAAKHGAKTRKHLLALLASLRIAALKVADAT
ncbi:MAG: helix-turn-helix domain-containing protein [Pseudomonadota bacterium]